MSHISLTDLAVLSIEVKFFSAEERRCTDNFMAWQVIVKLSFLNSNKILFFIADIPKSQNYVFKLIWSLIFIFGRAVALYEISPAFIDSPRWSLTSLGSRLWSPLGPFALALTHFKLTSFDPCLALLLFLWLSTLSSVIMVVNKPVHITNVIFMLSSAQHH